MFLQNFNWNLKTHPSRLEIYFSKILIICILLQLAIKVLHKSANIY